MPTGKHLTELDGFILTRQWVESSSGVDLIFWLASKSGPLRLRFSEQEAVCFFPSKQQAQVEEVLTSLTGWRIATTKLKNFDQQPISALYLKSQRKLFDIRDRLVSKEYREKALIKLNENCDSETKDYFTSKIPFYTDFKDINEWFMEG